MTFPVRTFNANEGDASTGTKGPTALKTDIDNSNAMFNPGATLSTGDAGGIGVDNIRDGAVSEVKIATAAVSETKIKDGAVTTAKIPDGAVTAAKIASVVGSVAVLTGDITEGQTLPVPSGFTAAQCKDLIYPRVFQHDHDSTGLISFTLFIDTGRVAKVTKNSGLVGTCNVTIGYIVVGVK